VLAEALSNKSAPQPGAPQGHKAGAELDAGSDKKLQRNVEHALEHADEQPSRDHDRAGD
jgi:hypothetical protein